MNISKQIKEMEIGEGFICGDVSRLGSIRAMAYQIGLQLQRKYTVKFLRNESVLRIERVA